MQEADKSKEDDSRQFVAQHCGIDIFLFSGGSYCATLGGNWVCESTCKAILQAIDAYIFNSTPKATVESYNAISPDAEDDSDETDEEHPGGPKM